MKRFLAGLVSGITLATSLSLVPTAWTQSPGQRTEERQRLRQQQLRIEMENQSRDTNRRVLERLNQRPC